MRSNPLLSGLFLEDGKFVGAGFDKVPYLFESKGGEWSQTKILDAGVSKNRQLKITGNKFKDTRVYFNPDFKLTDKVQL